MTSLKKILLGEQGLVVIFAIAFVIVSLSVPNFLTERNMLGLLQSVVTIGIVSCTMMFCLASRDFDLSVGSTVAFSGMIAVMVSNASGSIVLGLLGALICGSVVGFVNGVVIAKFRINALITTLATPTVDDVADQNDRVRFVILQKVQQEIRLGRFRAKMHVGNEKRPEVSGFGLRGHGLVPSSHERRLEIFHSWETRLVFQQDDKAALACSAAGLFANIAFLAFACHPPNKRLYGRTVCCMQRPS